MSGITGLSAPDSWAGIGEVAGGASKAAGLLGSASIASALVPGAGWVQLGLQLLSGMMQGDSSQAGAGSGGESQLNTSGWVVGEGDAVGGGSSSSNSAAWPWYVWAALTVGAVVIIRKAG